MSPFRVSVPPSVLIPVVPFSKSVVIDVVGNLCRIENGLIMFGSSQGKLRFLSTKRVMFVRVLNSMV